MLTADDFQYALSGVPVEEVERVITNVEAMAARFAPVIKTAAFQQDETKVAILKAIVSKAVIYEIKSGNGSVASESAGGFSHTVNTTMPQSSLYFSPQQIAELKSLGAFPVAQGMYSMQLTVGGDA